MPFLKLTASLDSALLLLNITKRLSVILNPEFVSIYKAPPNLATLLLNCTEEFPLSTTIELLQAKWIYRNGLQYYY